jgi:signal transduction histidine kinase
VKTRVPRRIGHDTELVGTRKNGKKFPANISFSVSEVDGQLYFTGIVRDLTETRALQEKILKSERLAALGQVVAEIAHEIKNPLMMIGGFANQLLRQPLDEKTLSKLEIISKEAARLEELLDELRMYYQPRSLQLEKIDMNSLLEDIFSLVEHDCRSKNINTVFTKEDKPLFVEGDRDRLKQVFLNLIKNAIEAMADGGRLHIHTKLINGLVEATIADEGCGIPECDKEEIFSPFFTTKRHGTGLGLSISKSIVEAHQGGAFTFTSKEGKGTTFKITMPVFRA